MSRLLYQEERDEENRLTKKLYVGNIPFTTTEAILRELFEPHGSIESINVITDRETGRARGFAFVEMDDAASASKAMQALDGQDLGGRSLRVNEANDRGSGGTNRRSRY
jgi:RNA recognition motif-containing protein